MKFFSSLSLLFLAGAANAQYKCYCTGFGAANPDQFSNTCCATLDGVTFPDGVDRKGTWLNDGGLCQFSGLGQFTLNQFISSYAACCASTGPQEGDKYGGNCF
ncbi:hypothetical protein CKAH01_05921 [Colletotrichum kahawae]|uniref:Uncharacterized protein n=1 Tax=Colletotrichum kahawae TaxID=34407 RepID=A0AAD9YC88_COLKA|nr:hypothetical protein CcaCcLH18_10159 [Colletotrichum camelliae]KAK2754907.1 hypothetical protein CKAH01_05921 [Colletotrichum kahawae]